ncbi:MAG: response regulator [Gemmatimonadetes bacterium]|nr:response regulator [Gemmatimonadota bacterium]
MSVPSILVIDDETHMRSLIARTLAGVGYDVEEAEDGESGLARLESPGIVLVLTDLLMPGREGLETILEMRRRWPAIPVIAMSGGGVNPAGNYLELAHRFGASATIAKPFKPSELIAVIRDHLPG